MSRSKKHTSYCGDKKNKMDKKIANRKIRRSKETYPNKSYRKKSESYDICDFCEVGVSFDDYYSSVVNYWMNTDPSKVPCKKKCYQDWHKKYIRK